MAKVDLAPDGYPVDHYVPGDAPEHVREPYARGMIGQHGPLGGYVLHSDEERRRAHDEHIAECNQCRFREGLPFNPDKFFFRCGA